MRRKSWEEGVRELDRQMRKIEKEMTRELIVFNLIKHLYPDFGAQGPSSKRSAMKFVRKIIQEARR